MHPDQMLAQTTAAKVREPEVMNRLNALDAVTNLIFDDVQSLADRLSAVTRQEETPSLDVAQEPCQSIMAQTLDLYVTRCQGIHERLHSILNRLEI